MHFSPCGWFCFEVPEGWNAYDTPHNITLMAEDTMGSIYVESARKHEEVQDQDMWDLQENSLKRIGLPAQETSRYTLPQGLECIYTACYNSTRAVLLTWVFWTRYCVSIEMEVPLDQNVRQKVDAFKVLLASLESLTTD